MRMAGAMARPPTTPIGSLSGGERQAVAIARAMYFDSDLIILDEATEGLAPLIVNDIWRVKFRRSAVAKFTMFYTLATLAPLVIFFSLGRPFVASITEQGGFSFLPLLSTSSAFILLNKLMPATRVSWRASLLGGIAGAALFELGKRGFALFLANITTYEGTYGALAALPVFCVWAYVSWLIVLFSIGIAAPAYLVVAQVVGTDAGALFAATLLAGYLTYEVFHAIEHLPPEHGVTRLPWIRQRTQLHRLHHRRSLMRDCNFNLVFPLTDWLLGTLYWEPIDAGAPGLVRAETVDGRMEGP